jgi:hypothetical protein
MTPGDYVVSNLANLMYSEPEDDALLGYQACGFVVRNRVLAGWEGGDWLSVIQKHDTYSANPPAGDRVLRLGNPHYNMEFRRVLSMAEAIYNGRERDITEGALWYGRLNNASPWFKENVIQRFGPAVATIGKQSFWR